MITRSSLKNKKMLFFNIIFSLRPLKNSQMAKSSCPKIIKPPATTKGQYSSFPRPSHSFKTPRIKLRLPMPNSMLPGEMLLCKRASTNEPYMTFQRQFALKRQMLHITVCVILVHSRVAGKLPPSTELN